MSSSGKGTEGPPRRVHSARKKQMTRPKSALELTDSPAGHELLASKGTKPGQRSEVYGSAPNIAKKPCIHESYSESSFSKSKYNLEDTAIIPFDLIYSLCELLKGVPYKTLNQLALRLGMRQDSFDHVCQSTQRPIRFILIRGERKLDNLQQLQMIFHELGLFEAVSLVSKHGSKGMRPTGVSSRVVGGPGSVVANSEGHVEFQTNDDASSENESPQKDGYLLENGSPPSEPVNKGIPSSLVVGNDNDEKATNKELRSPCVVQYDTNPTSTSKFTNAGSSRTKSSTAQVGAMSNQLLANTTYAVCSIDSGIGSYEMSPYSTAMSPPSHPNENSESLMAPWESAGFSTSDTDHQTSGMSPPSQPKTDFSLLESGQRHISSSSITDRGQSSHSLPYCGSGASQGSSERFSSLDLSFSGELQSDCPVVIQQNLQDIVDQQSHPQSRLGIPVPSIAGSARPYGERPPRQEPSVSNHVAGRLTVSDTIDDEGGLLYVPDSLIHMRIPPGALTRRVRLQLSIILDPDQPGCPQSANCPRIMPLVRCEPDGLEFEQPVELVLPHCGIIMEPEPKFEVYYRNHYSKFETDLEWKRDPFASSKATLDCHGNRQTCHIMLRHFCDIDVFIKDGENVIGKMLRSFPLVNRVTRPGDDLLLSTWLCNDYNEIYNDIIREHAAGVLLASYQPYMLLVSKKPLIVKFNSLNEQHIIASNEERINYHHLWHSSRGYATFRISRGAVNSDDDLLNGTLTVQQQDNEGIKFEIQWPVMELLGPPEASFSSQFQFPPQPLATQQSEPGGSDKQQLTSPVTLNGSELYIGPNDSDAKHVIHVHLSPPHTSSQMTFNQTITPMPPPTFQVDHSLAVELTMCLDGKDPLGHDWQSLADKFTYRPNQIEAFGREQHPAKSILDAACKSGRLTSIEKLRSILKDMERQDALDILDAHVTKHRESNNKSLWHPAGASNHHGSVEVARQMYLPFPVDKSGATHCGPLTGNDPVFVDEDTTARFSQRPVRPSLSLPHVLTPPINSLENYQEDCQGREVSYSRYPLPKERLGSTEKLQDLRLTSGPFSVDGSLEMERVLLHDEHEGGANSLTLLPIDQRSVGSSPVSGRSDEVKDVGENSGSFPVKGSPAAGGEAPWRANEEQQPDAENCRNITNTGHAGRHHLESLPLNQHQEYKPSESFSADYNRTQEVNIGIHSSSSVEELENPIPAHMLQGGSGDGQHNGREMSLGTKRSHSSQATVRMPERHQDGFEDISGISCHYPLKTPEETLVGRVNGTESFSGSPEARQMPEPFSGSHLQGDSIECAPSGGHASTNGLVHHEEKDATPSISSGDQTRSLPVHPIHSSTPRKSVVPLVQRKLSCPTKRLSLGDGSSLSLSEFKDAISQIISTGPQKADDSGFSSPVSIDRGRSGKPRRQRSVKMAPKFGNANLSPVDQESVQLRAARVYRAQSSCSSNESGVVVTRGGHKHTLFPEDEDMSCRFNSLRSIPSVNESEADHRVATTQTGPPSGGNDKGLYAQSSCSLNESGVAVTRGGRKHTLSSEDGDMSSRFNSLRSIPSVNEGEADHRVATTQTGPPLESKDKGLHSQSSSEDSGIQDSLKEEQNNE